MSAIRRIGAVAAIAGAATVAFANPASADPLKGDPLTLTWTTPSGQLTPSCSVMVGPALDTNSNAVLHPVAFENVTVTINGEELDNPDFVKNGQRRGVDLANCTFEQEFQEDTPDGPITIRSPAPS